MCFGSESAAPFAPFHAADPLTADHVGPGARHGDLSLTTVEIDKHVALGRFHADLVIVIDQQLVVALHKVNFDSLNSPLRVEIESRE